MTKVFLLQHVHKFDDGHENVKLIGIYSTRASAEAALATVRDQSGFRDAPDGFSIDEYTLDPAEPQWAEGYVTAFPDGTFSN
jgi:hypothetical protein